jgi:AraC-like DNA-binding protein
LYKFGLFKLTTVAFKGLKVTLNGFFMPLVITDDSQRVLFRDDKMRTAEELTSSTIIEENMSINYDFGVGKFHELCFEGLHIAYGSANVYENLNMSVEMPDVPTMVSQVFLLHGDLTAYLPGFNACQYTSLEHNLVYNPDFLEKTEIKKQDGMEVVSLSFTKERFLELAENNGDVLNRLGEQVAGNRIVFLNKDHNQPITNEMLRILTDIRRCQFQGGIKKLFLQSKIFELLALQCEQYERSEWNGGGITTISATDREKIYYARDLLLSSLQQPPSLHDLSRKAGLNEFKLKTGFKKIFDNTVFGYLNDFRLDQARQLLLQENNRSLAQMADELGYSSLQHFCNAFRKKYGVSPGKVRQK